MMKSVLAGRNIFAFGSESDASFRAGLSSTSSSSRKVQRFLKKSPYIPFLVVLLVVLLLAVAAFRSLSSRSSKGVLAGSSVSSGGKIAIDKPLAQEAINREFLFPLKDDLGKEVSKITYMIQTVELRDQIILKGEKATAVEGKSFLIINLKITNDYQKSIQLNTRDYIRLSVNGSDEKLAPDIHNDPVEIQAISTKYTRLGFPINDTDKNLILQVGEITGKKESIPLSLK
jgi:hypothetical protein